MGGENRIQELKKLNALIDITKIGIGEKLQSIQRARDAESREAYMVLYDIQCDYLDSLIARKKATEEMAKE